MTRKKVIKKQKLEVVFDAQKRKEFLTGFSKRKNARRKKAQEEFERSLKEERKRIKQEIKDGFKHMKKSFEPLRELTEDDRVEDKEYEDDDVKVHIVELTNNDMAAEGCMLGANQDTDDDDDDDGDSEIAAKSSKNDAQDDCNCVPGMELVAVKKKPTLKRKTSGKAGRDGDKNGNDASSSKMTKIDENLPIISNKKDLNRFVKNKTLNKLHKSKVFKKKELMDKRANFKKTRRDQNNTMRSLPKHARKNMKKEPNRYSKGRKLNRKDFRKKQQNT